MNRLATVSVTVGLVLGSAALASSAEITFQVNMSAQIALGNFDPNNDAVFVAGDPINAWSTSSSPLASSSTDTNLWVGTFDVQADAGATVSYKYVLNTANGTVWEGNVGTTGGNGNRTFTMPATNETLPVVFFNNVTNSTSVTNLVTFQVDMSVQTALGAFDPTSGMVNLAGEFNNWSTSATPLTNSATTPNVWTATVSLTGADASAVAYKYVMNGTWEGNVGPGGTQNRSLTLARTNQVLPVVYFNNTAGIPVPTPLTFQVNLGVQTALGNFDPTSGTVEARGTFNNWAAGFTLTNSVATPTLYSGTWVDTNDAVGAAIQYQFVLNGTTWETAVGNRAYTLISTNEQTLPLLFFNNVSNLGPVSIRAANGQATLTWTAAPLVRLQSATSLVSTAWQDISNTQGSNSVTLPLGAGRQFYRLAAP